MKKPRLAMTSVVVIAFVSCFLLIPIPKRVTTVFTVQPRGAARVYVKVPGILKAVYVQPGNRVEKGDPIAELENESIQVELERLKRFVAAQNVAAETYRALGARGAMKQAEDLAADGLRQQKVLEQQVEDLFIRAPRDGFVIPGEKRPERPFQELYDVLPEWDRGPLDAKNSGAFFSASVPLCSIGDPRKMEAILIIDQSEIEFVRKNDVVNIKLDAYPLTTWKSTVTEIARREAESTPRQLSNEGGGELATKKDSRGRSKPLRSSYEARVFLQNDNGGLKPGFTGRAKIECRSRTLAQLLWRYLMETFRLRL